MLEAVAEDADARLHQALLVLRRVVLEVLREIAMRPRGRDRLDDRLPLRPLELLELGDELRVRRRSQNLAVALHRPNDRSRRSRRSNRRRPRRL